MKEALRKLAIALGNTNNYRERVLLEEKGVTKEEAIVILNSEMANECSPEELQSIFKVDLNDYKKGDVDVLSTEEDTLFNIGQTDVNTVINNGIVKLSGNTVLNINKRIESPNEYSIIEKRRGVDQESFKKVLRLQVKNVEANTGSIEIVKDIPIVFGRNYDYPSQVSPITPVVINNGVPTIPNNVQNEHPGVHKVFTNLSNKHIVSNKRKNK